jgi:hypothetical protein
MDFYISLIVGVSQAFIFNPADKAIYKSIIDNTPIMCSANWKKPFAGSTNNIYSRIITSGLYFYLIDTTKNYDTVQASFLISLTTSTILNPLNVIKYKSYGYNLSTYQAFIQTYNRYGLKFVKIGLGSLILRDFVFNMVYLNLKKDNNDMIYNCAIICGASVISSPFHYIRNMKYNNDDSIYTILNRFKDNIKVMNNKVNYVIKQLGLGHGTIRTVAGVYVGQVMYSTLKEIIK